MEELRTQIPESSPPVLQTLHSLERTRISSAGIQSVHQNDSTQIISLDDEQTVSEEQWEKILDELNREFIGDESAANQPKDKPEIYVFHGVEVKFPYVAYESQQQLMDGLIKGVLAGQNCLLESPTGTGKTAALLCALLGIRDWVLKERMKLPYAPTDKCTCGLVSNPDDLSHTKLSHQIRLEEIGSKEKGSSTIIAQELGLVEDLLDESSSPTKKTKYGLSRKTYTTVTTQTKPLEEACQFCITKSRCPIKPPKVYYATRTHSQINQVVRQLKHSPYCNTACMAILSSRNQSCSMSEEAIDLANRPLRTAIHGEESSTEQQQLVDNLDNACQMLRDNIKFNEQLEIDIADGKYKDKDVPEQKPECPHYKWGQELRSVYDQIDWTHDIEDLVKVAKETNCCSFYGSKYLHKKAELVICPYNYLLDPNIREAMKIDLTGTIIVFDEGHNIEDVCREASSRDIDSNTVINIVRRIRLMLMDIESKRVIVDPDIELSLKHFFVSLTSLSSWICNEGKKFPKEQQNDEQLDQNLEIGYTSEEIIKVFTKAGLGPNQKVYDSAFQDDDDEDGTHEPSHTSKLPKEMRQSVQSLIKKLQVLYENKGDFVMLLKKRKRRGKDVNQDNFILSLKCLNPAIAFQPIVSSALSVVVASGTLSPQTSFEGELQTKFEVKLSASHVIQPIQVWKGVASKGVNETMMHLTSLNQKEVSVQEDIGKSLVEICKIVPNGVLVFLPSYRFMNWLKSRWSLKVSEVEEPILTQIARQKAIFFEQSQDVEKFKNDMLQFKALACKNPGDGGITGAVLFAVFRGKVSEGIDFSDDQARAVVSLGIPYPPAMSFEIVSKKEYNTQRVPNLMSGHAWYTVQAFRAMNQAFGRCIRHKDDWGAIIIMDSRFRHREGHQKSGISKNLSGWVQERIKVPVNFKQFVSDLKWFISSRRPSVTV